MNRKEVYEVIKKMNLQEVVKKIYNKNYTNVPTDALLQVIANAQSFIPSQVEEDGFDIGFEPCALDYKINTLVDILFKKRLLLKSEVKAIMNV